MIKTRTASAPRRVEVPLADRIRENAHALTGSSDDYDPLMDAIGDARFVLLGEASHGTHEFYRERAQITKRLIREKGFRAVAAEADWPDAYRVNRYVRGENDDTEASEALGGFKRFPAWMWRNADMLDFSGWLRDFNENAGTGQAAGFYGLDLYSLYSSIEAVITYLDKIDPKAAAEARERYGCFDLFEKDEQAYGLAASRGGSSCEEEVIQQLLQMQKRAGEFTGRNGGRAADEFFYAEQNARIAKNAEEYYRAMYRGRVSSWNLRDEHMAETLWALAHHLEKQNQKPAKIVVWAHNSHLGNARYTQMSEGGELNLGQLVRDKFPEDSVLVGFTTYTGTVTAASEWGGAAERKQVRPALGGSYEELMHETGLNRFLLLLNQDKDLAESLREPPRLERAIGVIYRPETERYSHYFYAWLPRQFDALLHFDHTRAVEPLESTALWRKGEMPETYPTGF